MPTDRGFDLSRFPVHLGLGSTVQRQPRFTGGADWYMDYRARHEADSVEGRLVTVHSFSESWDSWEMHPGGDELIVCLAGRIVFHLELPDRTIEVTLLPQQAIVNPAGVWHTADVDGPATALFITATLGSETRPRQVG
jgi:quercetin dioxygenase-like cupin family protein